MGLDTTHGCFSAPYSTFNRFRYSLGHQVGIDLTEYFGYNPEGKKELNKIDNPLMPLFNHSDCDGELTVKESESIVKALNEILDNFNDKIEADFNFKQTIIEFRDGRLDAISKNEVVKFR